MRGASDTITEPWRSAAWPLWRARWWIWLVASLAAFAAYGLGQTIEPTYRSSSTIRLPGREGADSARFAQLAAGDAVLRPAARRLGLPADDLAGAVTATADGDLLTIEVEGPSGSGARRRADAVTRSLVGVLDERRARGDVVQSATAGEQTEPEPLLYTLGAVLVAALGAAALALRRARRG